jgi:KDO2-lipid IV(A) lauroyltransferase
MKTKKIKKEVAHILIYVNFVAFFYVIRALPAFTYRPVSRFMGCLAFFLSGSNRKKISKNLKIAYGDTFNSEERKRITKDLLSNIVLSFCEVVWAAGRDAGQIVSRAVIEGEEKLKSALATGQGVVGVCSHMGNFPLQHVILVKKGYPANVIVKNPTAMYLSRFCERLACRNNVPFISKREVKTAVKDAQEWLSSTRGILSFFLDQHSGRGAKVEFYGVDVLAPTGAALFARKYNCIALGIFTHRLRDGRHRIIIEGPYPLNRTDDPEEDARINTSYFMKRVEHYVRLYPEEWFTWLHRRFR